MLAVPRFEQTLSRLHIGAMDFAHGFHQSLPRFVGKVAQALPIRDDALEQLRSCLHPGSENRIGRGGLARGFWWLRMCSHR